MLRHPFPLRDQPHGIEFIQGMGRGVEGGDRERQRERENRGVEVSHEHMERRGGEWGGEEQEKGDRARARRQERGGSSSPFYSESGTPGNCSLEEMLTLWVLGSMAQNNIHSEQHSATYRRLKTKSKAA